MNIKKVFYLPNFIKMSAHTLKKSQIKNVKQKKKKKKNLVVGG